MYGEEWNAYGPYISNQDGRARIVLYDGKKRKTRQYAKILIEIKLGRLLNDTETVDHIDEDKTNDDVDNLQILTKEENSFKSSIKVLYPIVNCVWCNKSFRLRKDQLKKSSGPFCGKTCTGKFGSSVRSKTSSVIRVEPMEDKIYYK